MSQHTPSSSGDDPAREDDRKRDDEKRPATAESSGGGEESNKGETARHPLSGRTKLVLLVLGVIVVAAAALWFIRYQTRGKFLQSTDDATVQADAVTVAPRISGYVEAVLVRDNEDVRAGQPLVRIDGRDAQAQAAQAQAQIAQGDASADAARASIGEQQAAIGQARAQLASDRIKAAHDAGEVARYVPLVAARVETREQLAQLQTTAAQSAQAVRADEQALLMQQRRVGSYRAQVRQGVAQAAGAKAQLASANVDVGATLLRAAIDGRIGDKTVTVGQYTQAGTRLMSVVPVNQLYITANFKETQLALMRPGQPATIEVDALHGTALRGRVESLAPGTGAQFSLIAPNNATGNFTKIVQRVPVRISVEAGPAARRLLLPGLSVTVTVDTISARDDLAQVRDEQRLRGDGR